jgi:cobalt/nickel transport system ATP-binding protein
LVDFILQQRSEGKTVVAATHDLELVQVIATRIYVFDEDHHIAAVGQPQEIMDDHDLLHKCNLVHYHIPGDKRRVTP